jgi:hypothetical protein
MDDGRDGGRPGSPAGPVMPSMRLLAELRFDELGRCAAGSSLATLAVVVGSRVAWSSCATMAGREVLEVLGVGSTGVVIAQVRR